MANWSPQQDAALKAVNEWLRNPGKKQWFYLAGYAGTGKTTLAKHLAEGVDGLVLFGAYTGKAALVLQSKGCHGARTIHSMIYRPETDLEGNTWFVLDRDVDRDEVLRADQILVGRNLTRQRYNARMRKLLGFEGELPMKGEKLVCLRNNSKNGLLNGQTWEVIKAEFETLHSGRRKAPSKNNVELDIIDAMTGHTVQTRARVEDFRGEEIDLPWRELRQFDRFDYGYALTCHKAQGSQWDSVYLFDESGVFREDAPRWLYTGLTRAAKRITVVV